VDDDVECLHVEKNPTMTCSGSHLYKFYRFVSNIQQNFCSRNTCKINHFRMVHSQQNVVYKRILQCDQFGVSTFAFHLKILFTKFWQQCAEYRLGICMHGHISMHE
jgi:hypothetical protein